MKSPARQTHRPRPTRVELEAELELLRRSEAEHRQVEEKLRRLAQFPEENPNPVLRVALDGALLFANASARTLLLGSPGQSESEMLSALRGLAGSATQVGQVVERELPGHTGQSFWCSALRPRGEDYVNLYARDITQEKRAEAALRASERFSRAVLNSLPAHIAVLDPQGIIVSVNARWERYARDHGRTSDPSLLPGANYLEVCRRAVAGGDALALQALTGIEAVMACAQPAFEFEYPCCGPAREQWFLMQVEPIANTRGGVIVSHLDITGRKQGEKALRQAHERLALAQTSAGAGMWDWDMTTGRLEWSPEMFRLFGLESGETSANLETWRRVLHPADREAAEERIQAAVLNRVRLENEYRILLPSGEERWISALGDATYDPDGRPLRMSGICIDVTARRQAEAELRRRMEELRGLNDELARFNSVAVGRELCMVELKREINALCAAAGQPPRYEVDFADALA